MEKGFLSILLHAHLPYVRHPEHERFLEERWFYEALTEAYIPLLKTLEGLSADGIDFRITLSMTPTLLSMMSDELLQSRYEKHLEQLIELASREAERTRSDASFGPLASKYLEIFKASRDFFCGTHRRDLTGAFKALWDSGRLEIITSAATHAYLPLSEIHPEAIRAQLRAAVLTHERILGRKPRGIWLPECGYFPGLDDLLKEEGLKFFVLDRHGILFGRPRPKYGIFAPVVCCSGVAAFGRDMESSKSVWSAEEGYPGDPDYREFYRDIGYDLDREYLRPFLNGDGSRLNTGIKYFRVTQRGPHKEPYSFERAAERAATHAGNFIFNRCKQVEFLEGLMGGQKPLIVSPYDAELFGHWWFEGPQWLGQVFRKLRSDQSVLKAVTLTEYLEDHPRNQTLEPAASSWGYKGYSEVWLNGSNDWIYRHLHKAAERMIGSARIHPAAEGLQKRALNQMARELLLLEASDWAFIMKTGTHTAYAVRRTREHLERFTKLWLEVGKNSIDRESLERIEFTDNIFPDIDYRVYSNQTTDKGE